MLLGLDFLGKDEKTKEDRILFSLKKYKCQLEIFSESNYYNFIFFRKNKVIKKFSVSDKEIGNNKSAIEIKSFLLNKELNREEMVLNLGYNGAFSFIYIEDEIFNIEIINPICETIEHFTIFLDDLFSDEF